MTKYPIILVHGILLKDKKYFKAFGKIEKVLKDAGYHVYTSQTDGFGSIETNAEQLKKQIIEILKKEKTNKINIIAHSKGGLDSKYMLENLDMIDYVSSLTTLATPHKGSPIASMLLKLPKFIIRITAWNINLIYKMFGDEHPNSYKVCLQLRKQDDEILQFNEEVYEKVYCQSYSATMKNSKDDFLMMIPHKIFNHYEKNDNDGLVSKESSKFAFFKGDCIDDSISHGQLVDISLNRSKKDLVYSFWLELCNDLKERGY